MKTPARILAAVYFPFMTVALTFPGVRAVNTIDPRVFGLPFVLVWILAWVLGSIPVLWFLHRTHQS